MAWCLTCALALETSYVKSQRQVQNPHPYRGLNPEFPDLFIRSFNYSVLVARTWTGFLLCPLVSKMCHSGVFLQAPLAQKGVYSMRREVMEV